ncbi:hypothetical protein ABFT80_01060 [Mesorhizobium sp. SB112]|uniref:hypothetical protein n=1 Tax=Mesorhizobium sp. SB112 TaxID=3151853 RepID=UPI003267F1B3
MIEIIQKLWAFMAPMHGQILSLIFTFVAAIIFWIARAKVKLIWGRTNNNLHMLSVNDGNVEIFCEKHFLQNTGRKPASNVEFVFSWKPDNVTVWQPRDHKQLSLASGEYSVQIPYIAPGELVIIDSVYLNKRGAFIASVKCSEALGKQAAFWTNRNFGWTFNYIVMILIILGIAFVFQALISLILGAAT